MEDNPEGTLSKRKMLEMYTAVLSLRKATIFVDEIFSKYDKDNSGTIDFKVISNFANFTSIESNIWIFWPQFKLEVVKD